MPQRCFHLSSSATKTAAHQRLGPHGLRDGGCGLPPAEVVVSLVLQGRLFLSERSWSAFRRVYVLLRSCSLIASLLAAPIMVLNCC